MLLDYFARCLHIFNWKDCLEIILISGVFYYFSLWLKTDKQKSLLFSFYGYCIAFFGTHYLGLTTVNTLLIAFFPVAILGFILVHQTTLQKNFVALHKISHPTSPSYEHWADTLLRVALIALSNNKRFYIALEKSDPLETIIQSPICLNSLLTEELFTLCMHSDQFDSYKFLWLNDQGILKGINSSWKKNSVETWLAKEVQEQEEIIQDALFFSTKTDLLFLSSNPTTRTFTLVCHGSLKENLSTSLVLMELKQYFNHTISTKGDTYASTYQQNKSFEQLHS